MICQRKVYCFIFASYVLHFITHVLDSLYNAYCELWIQRNNSGLNNALVHTGFKFFCKLKINSWFSCACAAYMCMNVCMYVGTHMCGYICGGPRLLLGLILHCSSALFFEAWLLII